MQALYDLVVGINPPKPPEKPRRNRCHISAGIAAQKSKPKCKKIKSASQEYGFLKLGKECHHLRNLKRHKAVTLRMTPEEFDFFTNKMRTAKQKTQTDFFLAVLRKKPIIVIEDLRPVLQELKRHGNNLNQITRRLHESAEFGTGATKVMNECWKTYRAISKLEGAIINAVIQRKGGKSQAQESD